MRWNRDSGSRRGLASTRAAVCAGVLAGIVLAVPISLTFTRSAAGPSVPAPGPAAFLGALAAPQVNPAEQARRQRVAGLQRVLDEQVSRINGITYVHVRLEDGSQAGIRADLPVDPASVIKVPVMVALYDAWQSGAVKRSDADENRMRRMITRSKNVVTNELIDKLGMDRINAWLQANGYRQTVVQARILDPSYAVTNITTAEESTRLLNQILREQAVSPAASKEMRDLLLAQRWRERIPALLPPDTVCGNKTGTMSNLLHDVGFVEAPNGVRYTIAVFIERVDRATCKSDSIAALSRSVYDYLTATAPVGAAGRLTPSQPGERPLGGEGAWGSGTGGAGTSSR